MEEEYDFSKFRRINRDRFKNAEFECAPTDNIDLFEEIRIEFMEDIFEMSDGTYLLTDESTLSDMLMDYSEEEIKDKIMKKYEIDLEDVGNTLLCHLFSQIHRKQYGT